MTSSEQKICKNCKWAKPDSYMTFFPLFWFMPSKKWEFARCSNPVVPGNIRLDRREASNHLVTGVKLASPPYPYASYCSTCRDFDQMCGEDGRYYEARKP